ncbi:glutamyl-tRNA reductase [Bacilliculturomica massiliensis]|uniref:glutamyl-tRNA reductase n=1 Tax=Bacilliculturomica massiliensis TaxID=1917867 RepID=UPI00102FF34D|nr:glutamyl-tRNA reductase [Bacilliculturomica massiliensis]
MNISMIGIDHSRASVAYRELFSFTRAQAAAAMKRIRDEFAVDGCLLLSTCNRTELWISGEAGRRISPYDMLCEVKGIDKSQYGAYFVERRDGEAVDHLFQLSCGLASRLFGEDQIISQVREALVHCRECGCDDMVIEKLFQSAIAAAKKVKSTVRITAADQSTAVSSLELLKNRMGSLKGVRCLVIGNGQMGRLIANALVDQGACVSMTLRKRIHGREEQGSIVPEGCRMVPYEDRIAELTDSQVVISATLSPHYTIHKTDIEGMKLPEQRIWLDLAVPRDIDPRIGEMEGFHVYDIDSLSDGSMGTASETAVRRALEILEDHAAELERWFAFREEVPQVKKITELAAEDVMDRLSGTMRELTVSDDAVAELSDSIYTAAEKSVGKILYGLRETLTPELWEVCMDALVRAAQKDTLKTGSPNPAGR